MSGRKFFVGGNWKCNGSVSKVGRLLVCLAGGRGDGGIRGVNTREAVCVCSMFDAASTGMRSCFRAGLLLFARTDSAKRALWTP